MTDHIDGACFITGCLYTDLDPRGSVATRDGQRHRACTAHWEAIIGIVGRQHGSDDEMRVTP